MVLAAFDFPFNFAPLPHVIRTEQADAFSSRLAPARRSLAQRGISSSSVPFAFFTSMSATLRERESNL